MSKTLRQIAQIFVAFSEKLNFTWAIEGSSGIYKTPFSFAHFLEKYQKSCFPVSLMILKYLTMFCSGNSILLLKPKSKAFCSTFIFGIGINLSVIIWSIPDLATHICQKIVWKIGNQKYSRSIMKIIILFYNKNIWIMNWWYWTNVFRFCRN